MKLFAFWTYDQFPFVLGSPVVRMLDNGDIVAATYENRIVRPIKLMPLKEGHKLLIQLEQLRRAKQTADAKTAKEFMAQVKDLLPEAVNGR